MMRMKIEEQNENKCYIKTSGGRIVMGSGNEIVVYQPDAVMRLEVRVAGSRWWLVCRL